MTYADAGHRPHAVHTLEEPTNAVDLGPYGLIVTLDTWGPKDFVLPMADYLQSNWGDAPSRLDPTSPADSATAHSAAERAFQRKTLQQVLEGLTFWFTIDGVCRPATHQIVRTRLGAAFMQHGGRDNDWRHRRFSIPETVRRLARKFDAPFRALKDFWSISGVDDALLQTVSSPHAEDVLDRLMGKYEYPSLTDAVLDVLQRSKDLYAALVDAGVPWQDARRFLPMGTQTYIHAIYNYVALRDVLANRLEHVMDWEINCVAQLMLRELRMKCPPLIWQSLGSHSDIAQQAKFAGLESWPPDGKWPVPPDAAALPRTHHPEQNPFWVLHPDAMAGGPVRWIPTNGQYPHLSAK